MMNYALMLLCPCPTGRHFGIARSVRLSVPWGSYLGYRHTGCLQLSHHRPPEMCGLPTRPLTDVDPPRFLPPSNCRRREAYRLAAPSPGRHLVYNKQHIIHPTFPGAMDTKYHFKPRPHNFKLTIKNKSITECDFITRMIFKDVFWHYARYLATSRIYTAIFNLHHLLLTALYHIFSKLQPGRPAVIKVIFDLILLCQVFSSYDHGLWAR